MVLMASFLCNGIVFGIFNTFGVIFVYLKKEMNDDPDVAVKASFVGSLGFGIIFLMSPISGILSDRYGPRWIAFCGACIATLGMALSAAFVHQVKNNGKTIKLLLT